MDLYFNGQFFDESTSLPIHREISFLRGYAIFDFFAVQEGVPLFIEDYLDRFYSSARLTGLNVPIGRNALLSDIENLITRNGGSNLHCKMILTGGYTEDGFRPGGSNLYIFPKERKEHPGSKYTNGVILLKDDFKRENPSVKSTNYMNAIMRIPAMDAIGAEEILYHDSGYIRECSRCNFFVVKNQKIITPSDEILKGITRKQLIEVARKEYTIEERNVAVKELETADEAFITSTTKILFPVVKVDDQIIGTGKVGPISQHLLSKMRSHISTHIANHRQT